MVNIAERVHRIRRRRDYQIAGASPQPDGLHDVIERLKSAGVDIDELLRLLPRLDVEPVLTAHPTEASRRSLLEKEQEIVRARTACDDTLHAPRSVRKVCAARSSPDQFSTSTPSAKMPAATNTAPPAPVPRGAGTAEQHHAEQCRE